MTGISSGIDAWYELASVNPNSYITYSTSWRRPERPDGARGENLQEIRWVLKDTAGVDLPPPARKTIELEGGLVKDAVRKALKESTERPDRAGPCNS
jgi:hypothetical protein